MFSVASVCLSVCLFVCSHDNFRTIRHRMMKLGDYVNCTKLSSKFECQGQRSKVDITGDKKNEKVRHFFSSFPLRRCPQPVLLRWENQRMLSSIIVGLSLTVKILRTCPLVNAAK